jgi:hypothetical protein
MSKAKLAAAKELIQERRYEEAKAILRTVNHPTAYKWLSQLDARMPPPPPPQLNAYMPPPPPIYSPYSPSLSAEQEKFYIRENRRARRKQIGRGFWLIGAGILCFVIYSLLTRPVPTIPGSLPRTTSIEVVFIPMGILAIIAGLYLFTKRD